MTIASQKILRILKHQLVFFFVFNFFVYFSIAFPSGEWVNLAFSIICFWLESNIYLTVRYSYLLVLPDDRTDIFATSLFSIIYHIYRSFSSLIWSSIVMILLYIHFKRFFLKLKRLSDGHISNHYDSKSYH